jgi:hypothetical protein
LRPEGRGGRPAIGRRAMPNSGGRIPMESRNSISVHPEYAPHHPPEHRPGIKPLDRNHLLVVRTVLWVIAGLVFLGFAIWWALT